MNTAGALRYADATHGPLREQVLLLAAQGVGTRQGFAEVAAHLVGRSRNV